MKLPKYSLIALFIIITLAALALMVLIKRGSRPETIRRGNTIVGAIDKYYADQGKYPATLTDLIPSYLEHVEPPTWGLRTWKYQADNAGFELGVDESKSTGDGNALWLKYLGPKLGWQIGD